MKRSIYLFLSTAIIISVIFMSGYLINKNTADVYVYTILKKDIENTINVQGKLQYSKEKDINVEYNCIIDKISVSEGEKVDKGDILFTYYKLDENIDTIFTNKNSMQAISELTNDTLLLKQIKDNYKIKTMYSKSSGTISGINVLEGGYAEKNSEILKITDKSSLEIPVNINETSISKIEINQKVKIKFPALNKEIFSGTITDIAEEAKQTTGLTGKETTVEVIITLDEELTEVRAGYSANCSIITSTDKDVIIVPYQCIRSDGEREYIYTAENNKAKKRHIETGTEYKEGVSIKSGIENGEQVIKNCDSIYDGQSINIISGENIDE